MSVPVVLPRIMHADSKSRYEMSWEWRDCLRYVEAALVEASNPNAPLIDVPADGEASLRVVSGAEGAVYQAEHFIRRIASNGAISMEGLVVDANFPMLTTAGSYAAAILLAAVSVITRIPIRAGTAAMGELTSDGKVLPIPLAVETCDAAVRVRSELAKMEQLSKSDCHRLLLPSSAADDIFTGTNVVEGQRKGQRKFKGIEICKGR